MSRILGFSVFYYFQGHFDPEDLFLCTSILFRAFLCVVLEYWGEPSQKHPVSPIQF